MISKSIFKLTYNKFSIPIHHVHRIHPVPHIQIRAIKLSSSIH